MRRRLLWFVQALRRHGLEVSPGETMDAVAAVAAAGVEREVLREALAATLVKDERDRTAFDALFDTAFPLAAPAGTSGAGRARDGRGAGGGAGARGEPSAGGAAGGAGARRDGPAQRSSGAPATPPADARGPVAERDAARPRGAARPDAATREAARGQPADAADASPASRPDVAAAARDPDDGDGVPLRALEAPGAGRADVAGQHRHPGAPGRRARREALLVQPFAQMTARDVAEARELVADLGARLRGRLARRERRARRGRLDLRRTVRAAAGTGGVPVRLRHRTRRPGRPDLVALCDLSGSVAAASELLLGLLAPAQDFFRRVHTFAFVDRLCAVSIERGHVAPEDPIDLYGRSDLGRVLDDLWPAHAGALTPSTLLLVLGDARNNRRPPRIDLWREIAARAGTVVWLVPEPRARWDTGDSVLGRYAPACDAVVECLDLATLVAAVRRAF